MKVQHRADGPEQYADTDASDSTYPGSRKGTRQDTGQPTAQVPKHDEIVQGVHGNRQFRRKVDSSNLQLTCRYPQKPDTLWSLNVATIIAIPAAAATLRFAGLYRASCKPNGRGSDKAGTKHNACHRR
jgi:hypothetical protein